MVSFTDIAEHLNSRITCPSRDWEYAARDAKGLICAAWRCVALSDALSCTRQARRHQTPRRSDRLPPANIHNNNIQYRVIAGIMALVGPTRHFLIVGGPKRHLRRVEMWRADSRGRGMRQIERLSCCRAAPRLTGLNHE